MHTKTAWARDRDGLGPRRREPRNKPRGCPPAQERNRKENENISNELARSAKGLYQNRKEKTAPRQSPPTRADARGTTRTHLVSRRAPPPLRLRAGRVPAPLSLPGPAPLPRVLRCGVAFWGLAREIKGRKGLYGLRRIDPVKEAAEGEEAGGLDATATRGRREVRAARFLLVPPGFQIL